MVIVQKMLANHSLLFLSFHAVFFHPLKRTYMFCMLSHVMNILEYFIWKDQCNFSRVEIFAFKKWNPTENVSENPLHTQTFKCKRKSGIIQKRTTSPTTNSKCHYDTHQIFIHGTFKNFKIFYILLLRVCHYNRHIKMLFTLCLSMQICVKRYVLWCSMLKCNTIFHEEQSVQYRFVAILAWHFDLHGEIMRRWIG